MTYRVQSMISIRLWCHHMVTLFEFCLHHFVIGQTGGLSNRQKERKKNMPTAAKKAKVARTQLEKKKKQQRAGKEFRGRKAWKWLETLIAFLHNVIYYIFWMANILSCQFFFFFPPWGISKLYILKKILQQVSTILQKSCWDSQQHK